MLTPFRKILLILVLTTLAGYISLPKETPVGVHFKNINVENTFRRQDLVISRGRFQIEKKFDLILGLDLSGGSHLVFEADTNSIDISKRKTALESLRDIMEKRVNLFGISEPNVQTSSFEGKDRIIIELPGVNDTKQAIELIGKTAKLAFVELGDEEKPSLTPTNLTGADLKSASVTFDGSSGKPVVSLEFTPEGGDKFAEIRVET